MPRDQLFPSFMPRYVTWDLVHHSGNAEICMASILPTSSNKHQHPRSQPTFFFLFIPFPGYIYFNNFSAQSHDIVIIWMLLKHGHISCKYAHQIIYPVFVLFISLCKLMPGPPRISFANLPQSPSFFCTSGNKIPSFCI